MHTINNYRISSISLNIMFALIVGILTAINIYAAVILVMFLLLFAYIKGIEYFNKSFYKNWLNIVFIILCGYSFLGKGFAYIGVSNLYIGDAVLILGLLFMLMTRSYIKIFNPVFYLLVLLIFMGTAYALPYLKIYKIDVLRDSVIWGYGIYAILISQFLLKTKTIENVPIIFAKWIPIFLFWAPLAYILQKILSLPTVFGSNIPVILLKPGDLAVFLSGIGIFMTMNLFIYSTNGERIYRKRSEWIYWLLWLVLFILVSSANRGGMLAIVLSMVLGWIFNPNIKFLKPTVIIVLFISIIMLFNLEIDLGMERKISIEQLVSNVKSIFIDDNSGLTGTREFRLIWWNDIINYTFFGEYFWSGKGFGINLANSDGHQILGDNSLRSPHNAHLTFLARMGVPGFIIWVVLQISFATQLIRGYFKCKANNKHNLAKLNIWTLGFWFAAIINMSFDVYLEGPQGGIWFWCIFGYGLALIEYQRGFSQKSLVREGI